MGLQWLIQYRLFSRRRKYSRVLGEHPLQAQEPPFWTDPYIHERSTRHNIHIRPPPSSLTELQSNGISQDLELQNSRKHADAHSSKWPRFAKKHPHLRLFGFRLWLRRGGAHAPPPSATRKAAARFAVENFLAGPSQVDDEDELYQRQCREMLRKLSARGNKVPGFM